MGGNGLEIRVFSQLPMELFVAFGNGEYVVRFKVREDDKKHVFAEIWQMQILTFFGTVLIITGIIYKFIEEFAIFVISSKILNQKFV